MGINAIGRKYLDEAAKLENQRILQSNVLIDDFPLDPPKDILHTNNFIQQGLDRMLGFDSTKDKWVRLKVDSNGRLEVATVTTLDAAKLKVYDGTDWQNFAGSTAGLGKILLMDRDALDVQVMVAEVVPKEELISHAPLDVEKYSALTVMVSTDLNCTVYPQVSADGVTWFDMKSAADGDLTWNCNNENISFSVDMHRRYFRVVIYNAGATNATVSAWIQGLV